MAESPQKITPPANRVSLEDFTLIKVIGKGTYGKVMLVRHKKVYHSLPLYTSVS